MIGWVKTEANTNKEKVKFKDLKPVKFVIKHKKPFIIGGVVVAVTLAIVIPLAVNSGAYKGDFTFAYDSYQDIKQADKKRG